MTRIVLLTVASAIGVWGVTDYEYIYEFPWWPLMAAVAWVWFFGELVRRGPLL